MMVVAAPVYDLWYDANTVGADLVVETSLNRGPRANDASFDPGPGGWVLLGDDHGPPMRAQVTWRDGDRLRARISLDDLDGPVARRRLRFVGAGASTSGKRAADAAQILADGGFGAGGERR